MTCLKTQYYMNKFDSFLSFLPAFSLFPFIFYFLPPSLSFLDSWPSNKSFSSDEGAVKTLTWSPWPRNTSSFLLHMVGSLTEFLHVRPGLVRSKHIFWAPFCFFLHTHQVRSVWVLQVALPHGFLENNHVTKFWTGNLYLKVCINWKRLIFFAFFDLL